MSEELMNEMIESVGTWTVVLDTIEDGIQVFKFNTLDAAMEFASSQRDDLRFVMETPLYIANMKHKVEEEW